MVRQHPTTPNQATCGIFNDIGKGETTIDIHAGPNRVPTMTAL
jgi:hypothetical protein